MLFLATMDLSRNFWLSIFMLFSLSIFAAHSASSSISGQAREQALCREEWVGVCDNMFRGVGGGM
ncbi:hypothetical protein DM860_014477 [Cuscuta australis]|uniref:Uncharacterized protein n=1 Tax=Cuscuta australis TaxID=267555 RepID=A0A328DXS3_9ASTE|nr:hypothetical protein DM860_014477 [Cuscuta australis]